MKTKQIESVLKKINEKAMKCGDSTKETRARKGAYVDCLIMIEKELHKNFEKNK